MPGLLSFAKQVLRRLVVGAGAVLLTLLFFLVLPLTQAIAKQSDSDMLLRTVDTGSLPPPPAIQEPEPEEEEEEPEEEPPELDEPPPLLDIAQLEVALDAGANDSWLGGDFAVSSLQTFASQKDDVDALFSLSDLDQEPRAVYQPSPVTDAKLQKHAPGTVYVLFIVDENGRVQNPIVQKSTDPVFERPALAAVKRWKFEPGKRNGQPVGTRMRIPITFPKGE